MHHLQMAIAVMSARNVGVGPRDAEGRRREYTVAELDALVEFKWPWTGVIERLAAGAHAITSRLRPQAGLSIEPTMSPVADAPATT